MLNDIVLQRARLGYDRVDMHRYATLNCGMARLFKRVGHWFS